MRAWHGLVERIKQIPVPVVLQLDSPDGPVSPPDAGSAKRIAHDLKNKLLRNPHAITFFSHGYTFLVMADPHRGEQMASPLGMHACFVPPSSRAGPVSAAPMMDQVREKAHTYRGLAEKYSVPLIVAVGAHHFTGVTLQHVQDILTGLPAPKITLQFDWGDPYIGEQTVHPGPVPPWQWPEGLDGLLWIHGELPFALTALPNSATLRPMPAALLPLPAIG
jgi:hypothetical protein